MLTYTSYNKDLYKNDLICIGVKACGATSRSVLNYFPELRGYITKECEDHSLVKSESFIWEERDKTILICVTASTRLRETSCSDLENFLKELLVIQVGSRSTSVGVVGLVNEFNDDNKRIMSTYLDKSKTEFTYYE